MEPERAGQRARGSQSEPERARMSQREPDSEPERAGQRARESQREPEGARLDWSVIQREPERDRASQRDYEPTLHFIVPWALCLKVVQKGCAAVDEIEIPSVFCAQLTLFNPAAGTRQSNQTTTDILQKRAKS